MKTQTGKDAIIASIDHYESERTRKRQELVDTQARVNTLTQHVAELDGVIRDLNAELAA